MKLSLLILSAVCGFCLMASTAFAADSYGEKIPDQAIKTTLAALIANPGEFEDKNVVVEGWFAGMCADGDMFFKDKTEIIEADAPTPEVMKLDKGTKLRLYGTVKVRRSSAEDKGHPHIEGKGAEVLP